MRTVEFKRRLYRIYTRAEADEAGIPVVANWRDGRRGDWVETDTGEVLEVLKVGVAGETPWIRTCCGTYPARVSDYLDATERENRYSFSGRAGSLGASKRARRFAILFARLQDPVAAFKLAFPKATSELYIQKRSQYLLSVPAIRKVVDDELERIAAKIGVSREWSFEEIKKLYDELKSESKIEAKSLRFRILSFLEDKLSKMKLLGEFEVTDEVTDKQLDDDARLALAKSREMLQSSGNEPVTSDRIRRKMRVRLKGPLRGDEQNNQQGGT